MDSARERAIKCATKFAARATQFALIRTRTKNFPRSPQLLDKHFSSYHKLKVYFLTIKSIMHHLSLNNQLETRYLQYKYMTRVNRRKYRKCWTLRSGYRERYRQKWCFKGKTEEPVGGMRTEERTRHESRLRRQAERGGAGQCTSHSRVRDLAAISHVRVSVQRTKCGRQRIAESADNPHVIPTGIIAFSGYAIGDRGHIAAAATTAVAAWPQYRFGRGYL